MPASIGVNLRVTGHCRQGGRKYMEDFFSVAYQQTEDERDLEYAFFGIYDGHGGAEAAAFAKEHLMETIIKHSYFWSDNDEDVLRAIKDGYIATHYNMWKEQEKWPRTTSGLPSTAGTTASVAFIRRGKIYIGHVGDSGIILGYQEPGCSEWRARPLTRDHKPENAEEMSRIESCGGKVVAKSGVPRVVWNRPRIGHQGPVRRSTPIDEIPFLAVARSLGDLWSYNSQMNQFIVSPDPDCSVVPIDCNTHRCLIFGTDGLFNMLSPQMAVHIVQQAERHNENAALSDNITKTWLNPSKLLVEKALERWHSTKMRADNTSVVTLMLDPPGPPRAQVLKNRKKNAFPDSGLRIMTRYEDEKNENACTNCNEQPEAITDTPNAQMYNHVNVTTAPAPSVNSYTNVKSDSSIPSTSSSSATESTMPLNDNNNHTPMAIKCVSTDIVSTVSSSDLTSNSCPLKERNFMPRPRESTSFDPRSTYVPVEKAEKENVKSQKSEDNSIQINEISSSSNDSLDLSEDEVSETHVNRINLRSKKKALSPKSKEMKESKDKAEHNQTDEMNTKKDLKSALEKKSQAKNSTNQEEPLARVTRNLNRKRSSLQPEDESHCQSRKTFRVDARRSYRTDCRRSAHKLEKPSETGHTSTAEKKPTNLNSRRLSLTQKIVQSKKIMMKKKDAIKRPLDKEKVKLALKNVKVNKIMQKPIIVKKEPKIQPKVPNKLEVMQDRKFMRKRNETKRDTRHQSSMPETKAIDSNSNIFKRVRQNSRTVKPKVYMDFVPIKLQRRKRGGEVCVAELQPKRIANTRSSSSLNKQTLRPVSTDIRIRKARQV